MHVQLCRVFLMNSNVEAKELQLDVEQISARDDRSAYGTAVLDKARSTSGSGGKARNSRSNRVRRSPYQAPSSAAATAVCTTTSEAGASKMSDEYVAPSCEYGEVVTSAVTPGYEFADDVTKVRVCVSLLSVLFRSSCDEFHFITML